MSDERVIIDGQHLEAALRIVMDGPPDVLTILSTEAEYIAGVLNALACLVRDLATVASEGRDISAIDLVESLADQLRRDTHPPLRLVRAAG